MKKAMSSMREVAQLYLNTQPRTLNRKQSELDQESQEKTCGGKCRDSDFEKHMSSTSSLRHHLQLGFPLHSGPDPMLLHSASCCWSDVSALLREVARRRRLPPVKEEGSSDGDEGWKWPSARIRRMRRKMTGPVGGDEVAIALRKGIGTTKVRQTVQV